MTRIGFAYNLKPEPVVPLFLESAALPLQDDDPASTRRDNASRSIRRMAPAQRTRAAAVASPDVDDEFAEWDGEETIAAVERALSDLGKVIRLEANHEFPERLRSTRPDIVFNIAEGSGGMNREAHVPAICEFFGIPYSGSDPFTLSLCLDKSRTKECLAHHGVPTPTFALIQSSSDIPALMRRIPANGRTSRRSIAPASRLLRLPLFVKPVHEGSSKGITENNFCRTVDELEAQIVFLLERYDQPVLVEEWLPGAEFTCAVLGNGNGARVLPIVGMNFGALPEGALPVYGFEAKWLWDRPENPLDIFECPAQIDGALERTIERVVLGAYHVLGCRDWSRIDVRLDQGGVPNVVEVNPLPGILPNPEDNSCFPKAARAAGMSYDHLIQTCARLAAERQGVTLTGRAARRTRRAAAAG
ncbi:MAG: D-alanine--D-alanine ligase [Gemmatimonadaceae bacterium]